MAAGTGWKHKMAALCRAIGQKIAQRKKTEMNGKGEILKAALEEDPPLTAEQMAERLGFGCPGVLRRNFPAEYKALLGKRMAYEEAQRKQLRSDLISALAEIRPRVFPLYVVGLVYLQPGYSCMGTWHALLRPDI